MKNVFKFLAMFWYAPETCHSLVMEVLSYLLYVNLKHKAKVVITAYFHIVINKTYIS